MMKTMHLGLSFNMHISLSNTMDFSKWICVPAFDAVILTIPMVNEMIT